MSRLSLRASLLATAFAALATAAAPAAAQVKAAWVYLGPTGDAGWTYAHDQGRKAVEKALGSGVKTTYVENVPESADAERVIRDLAAQGNQIIFTTSFGYMEPTLKVAREFPDVKFEHATGYKTAKNVAIYAARFHEGAYLAGIVAGKMTKTNVLGFVASFPIPEVIRNINAYTLGARSVNPKVETKVVWVSSWFDPGKEREAAAALISQKADVLLQNTDSPAVLQTAQEKGVYAFGWDSNMSAFASKAHLGSVVVNWGPYYTRAVKSVAAGTWKAGDTWEGAKEGMTDLVAFSSAVSPELRKLVADAKADISSGKKPVFRGPLLGQDGKEILAAGKSLDDNALRSMNFYVEGVQGALPK